MTTEATEPRAAAEATEVATTRAEQPTLGWAPWRRAFWYHAAFWARTWRGQVISSFLFPVLYLASMGLGVGKLVNHHSGGVSGVTYLEFVAPALLAMTGMQIASNESMWPILASFKWTRSYWTAVSTPITPRDLVVGKLSWVAVHVAMVGVIYTCVLEAFQTLLSPWALLLPLAGVLTGLAYAAPIAAFTATQENEKSFPVFYRFAIIPMFLFSGSFYPISQLPAWLRTVVQFVPLYHGVAICRTLALGQGSLATTGYHVGVLVALTALGTFLCIRNFRKRLEA
jgi:lipooligosaccharide transport system permease protein